MRYAFGGCSKMMVGWLVGLLWSTDARAYGKIEESYGRAGAIHVLSEWSPYWTKCFRNSIMIAVC